MLASFRQTHRLALVQKMGAQGDDGLAGLQRAGHPRRFIIQAEHGHGCQETVAGREAMRQTPGPLPGS